MTPAELETFAEGLLRVRGFSHSTRLVFDVARRAQGRDTMARLAIIGLGLLQAKRMGDDEEHEALSIVQSRYPGSALEALDALQTWSRTRL